MQALVQSFFILANVLALAPRNAALGLARSVVHRTRGNADASGGKILSGRTFIKALNNKPVLFSDRTLVQALHAHLVVTL